MNNEFEIISKLDPELSEETFESLKKNHSYIGEKFILDLVNGVGVVAKDLNNSAKAKEKGFARLWDQVSGTEKKRQNQINENVISGLESSAIWLQDHDRHLSRIDLYIKSLADNLYNTQTEILKFYEQFKELEFRVELLERFKKSAELRFEEIEKKLAKIEAQQHIDREIEKIGTLNLPIELEVFTVLDNLVSGEFGIWYILSEDKSKKEEQLKYLKNKLKNTLSSQNIKEFIDYYKLQQEVKKLEKSEIRAISFISQQYRQFNKSSLYDSVDIVTIVSSTHNQTELDEKLEENSHIRTFITLEDFIDDTILCLLDS